MEATLCDIIFRDGALTVNKKNQALQQVLSVYHTLKNKKYRELDEVVSAQDELVDLEIEIDALNMARSIDIDQGTFTKVN